MSGPSKLCGRAIAEARGVLAPLLVKVLVKAPLQGVRVCHARMGARLANALVPRAATISVNQTCVRRSAPVRRG
jgi:hypothetical protein